jgi:SAM-dependent methyltransferase
MNNSRIVNLNILVVSAAVICFEIISTRISSLIFVQNYAFIILSLAILGLGSGGIYSFYKIEPEEESAKSSKIFGWFIFLSGISLIFFIVLEIFLSITNPYVYFFLLFIPFFFAGIIYAEFFSNYANAGFKIYASDLIGAALGSILSIFIFDLFNAVNTVLFLALVLFILSVNYSNVKKKKQILLYLALFCLTILLAVFGKKDLLGKIPIGHFSEKDIYYTYDNPSIKPDIVESRWSINGRSDLVEYNNSDIVKDLFIDGAAGSQMFRFNGNIANHNKLLNNLLFHFSTAIPLLFLTKEEKKNMLVIGPGGGKEILTGILSEVQNITGVEVNPDFVDIVKEYRNYNGGIYTNFPNVNIKVAEGRHFIKSSGKLYNTIILALPSTKQLQNIDGLASNENFLLTVEAIRDYLKILTPNGQLIFTVHNRWELVRLIITTLYTFNENGITNSEAVNHFIILGSEYAPTIVIKKSAYRVDEIKAITQVEKTLPPGLPRVTYFPYLNNPENNEIENVLLNDLKERRSSLKEIIAKNSSDISPVRDDSPFFYKVSKGVPDDYENLLIAIFVVAVLSVIIPFMRIKSNSKSKRNKKGKEKEKVLLPLFVFIDIGIGFMILEISLFQKFILYLGSPTIALSILLGSLLVGMGVGSFFGGKIYSSNVIKRLKNISGLIVIVGVLLFVIHPLILNELLAYGLALRAIVCFILLLPFGFLLGIPFPTGIQILKQNNLVKYIPWMYGVNGIMSVLGSVIAVILSMVWGFTASFFAGLSMYLIIIIFLTLGSKNTKLVVGNK